MKNLRKISIKLILLSCIMFFNFSHVVLTNAGASFPNEQHFDENSSLELEYDVKKHLKSNNIPEENTVSYLFDSLNCQVIHRGNEFILPEDGQLPTSSTCYENLEYLDDGNGYYLGFNACNLDEGKLCVIYENNEGNIDEVPTNAYSKDLVNKFPQSFKFIKI